MKREEFKQYIKENRIELGEGMNARLMASYIRATGQTDFRTFKQWKEAGRKVRKGESSFPVFSRPIGMLTKEPNEDLMHRFGTCHLFHIGQTEEI